MDDEADFVADYKDYQNQSILLSKGKQQEKNLK